MRVDVAFELDEAGVGRLAEALALKLVAGDCVALHGDLGAGKSTLARAFIRAALCDPHADVPSPTFPIEQVYDAARGAIAHYDLYRLSGADELADIGFEERQPVSVVLVEWPERARELLPPSRLDLNLSPGRTVDTRRVVLRADGGIAQRVKRALAIRAFLDAAPPPWNTAGLTHLHGDASVRSYGRLHVRGFVARSAASGIPPISSPLPHGGTQSRTAILMDAPRQPNGPPIRDGKPYSQIARLAEDVAPFVAVGTALRGVGLAACDVLARDLHAGLLIVEDFGDVAYREACAAGHDQATLWAAAVDVLIALRRNPIPTVLPLPDGATHILQRFDRAALEIELDLILDWYWPAMTGVEAPADMRAEFRALWSPVLDRMRAEPPGIFLRDFHSPNLFWRPERTGTDRVGLIDFQDALAEPWAYDLASILQDARVDVPIALERREFARYAAAMQSIDPGFDADRFAAIYAAFGAQRNTRLIGLWVRLLKRDGKAGYLQHMPRTWDYLRRNLAHPSLAALRAFYERHSPAWSADGSSEAMLLGGGQS